MDGELHVALDTADFLAVFPLKGDGRARLIGSVREESELRRQEMSWGDVSKDVIERMRVEVRERQLVLDVPRAPPGRGLTSERAARFCSGTPRTSTAPLAARA